MTTILGISAYYHDSAAALVRDGEVVAAAQEERFTRVRHDPSFPERAIRYCLEAGGLAAEELDYVAFYEKPLRKFDRLLATYLALAPAGFPSFSRAIPKWLRERLFQRGELRRRLGTRTSPADKRTLQVGSSRRRHPCLVFPEHHESHAASAFYPSPFADAAVLTIDGVGEWATATYGVGEGHRLRLSRQLDFPHSLGLLYTAFTTYCGFRANSGEYKLMGLAPYGTPRFAGLILERLVELCEDGSFRLDQRYFNYCGGTTMTSGRLHRLLGRPPRIPESELLPFHCDVAASIQAVTEEIVLRMARQVQRETGKSRLCLAGGVALNCVANGRLAREGPFEELWIQPAAGDAGGALGAALLVWHQLLGRPRDAERTAAADRARGMFLGPAFDNSLIQSALDVEHIPYTRFDDEPALLAAVAEDLAAGRVVGWFSGRMEFGPRALGARSILGDPRSPAMQSHINEKIKRRESFRPFAPAVLAERAADYFAVPESFESPYMLIAAPVHERRRISPDDSGLVGLERRQVPRSEIPAVTHVDDSARLQTVDPQRHPRFHRLLKAVERRTECPVLVNTSFNVRGEPIVCTPCDAIRCFLATDMDVLVIEDFVVRKEQVRGTTRRDQAIARPAPRLKRASDGELRQFPGGLVDRVRRLHAILSRLLRPLGWLTQQLLLLVVYLLVFAPAAWLLRLAGYDPLGLRGRRGSYWRDRPEPRSERYLRQF